MTTKSAFSIDDPTTDRPGGLLAWQWASYSAAHRNRRNLVIHALTEPLFLLGCLAIPASFISSWWLAPAGVAALLGTLVAQGRGHALETGRPAPFRGPADFIARLVVEQWITFPRFVLSGRWLAAWRKAS